MCAFSTLSGTKFIEEIPYFVEVIDFVFMVTSTVQRQWEAHNKLSLKKFDIGSSYSITHAHRVIIRYIVCPDSMSIGTLSNPSMECIARS